MDTYSNIFDIIIVVFGFYMIYAVFQMKFNDIIRVGVILPPSVNEKMLLDREGFKKYAFPRHLAEGVIMVFLGMAGILLDLNGLGLYHAFVYLVVLAVWLIFYLSVERGKKKFYKQFDNKKKK